MSDVVATYHKKLCNCLIPEAEVDLSLYAVLRLIGVTAPEKQIEDVLNTFRALYGGLWVGGWAELTANTLTFHPNLLNRKVHAGDYSFCVPLRDITSVAHSWGWVTGIVTVTTIRGQFKLRCFGARRYKERVDHARAQAIT